jgi:hypothetical protein
MSDLVLFDHLLLLHLLHSDDLAGLLHLADPDLPEGSSADDRKGLEVLDAHLPAPIQIS